MAAGESSRRAGRAAGRRDAWGVSTAPMPAPPPGTGPWPSQPQVPHLTRGVESPRVGKTELASGQEPRFCGLALVSL